MHLNKWPFVMACTLLLVAIAAVAWLHAAPTPTIGVLSASPAYVVINTPTSVVFTIQIADPTVVSGGVNLLSVDATGKTLSTIGVMHDDGTNGDGAAADRVFSLQLNTNKSSVGPLYYRASVAFKGVLQRTLSNTAVVTLDPFSLPPDPGEAGKQTLEGIDSDHDGIRDDVQRAIAGMASSDAAMRSALTQIATVDQIELTLGDADNADLISFLNLQEQGMSCLFVRTGDAQRFLDLSDTVFNAVVNTDLRRDAHRRANALFGGQVISPPEPSASACR